MCVVRINARVCETVVDRNVMMALRRSVGSVAFDEMFEDALCDVTERLSAIERSMGAQDMKEVSAAAQALSVIAARIGLRSVSGVAVTLVDCCASGDVVAASAVAARLSRLGERCVLAAAELSVDIGASAH
ncbi:MAG: hypothetical protein ACPGSI_03500 [Pikeienuella sp.]